MLLDVKDVSVSYGAVEVLKNVSLSVEPGSIVTVLGANGAGKSTLLNAISNLVPLKSGEIRFRDERVDGLGTTHVVRKGITQVPERMRLFAHMNVLENIKLGAYLRKDDEAVRKDIESLYALFPIMEQRKRQAAGSLSGGEQQMAAIARGLMANPKLLLLDEPSLGLSPLMAMNVFRTIKEINRRGISVLLVEQNARLALQVANYAYVLETGAVVLEGKPEALLNDERVKVAYLGA